MRSHRSRLTPFSRGEHGAIAVYTALLIPVLLAAAGLATDVGYWHLTKKRLQSAMDFAAIGAATELVLGNPDGTVMAAGQHDSALNGFTDGANATVNVTVNHADNSVTVSSTTQAPRFFSGLVMSGPVDVTARAVAAANPPPLCMLALNGSGNTVSLSGGSSIKGVGCIVYSDSASSGTVNASGGAYIEAGAIKVVGTATSSGPSYYMPSPQTGAPIHADPYASVSPPSVGPCDHSSQVNVSGASRTFSPGVYCGGINLSGGAHATFLPGLYVIKDGELNLNGTSSASGDGVVFYLTGAGSLVNSSGGSTTSFTAPTSGPLAGFIFFQDRAVSGVTNVLSGGSGTKLDGILYFPENELDLTGGSSGDLTKLTTAVAGKFLFSGGSLFQFDPKTGPSGNAVSVSLIQ